MLQMDYTNYQYSFTTHRAGITSAIQEGLQ